MCLEKREESCPFNGAALLPPVFTDCLANAQQVSMKGRLLKKSSQMLIFINLNILYESMFAFSRIF